MSVSSVSSAYSNYSAYQSQIAAKKSDVTTDKTDSSAAQSSALKQLDQKLQMGSKLTSKEMSYLEAEDKNAFKEATKISDERNAYRKQLEGAKTKLDAETLRSTKMQELSDELKSVKNSASLTADEKTSSMELIQKRQMAIVNETQNYTSTAKYNNLSLSTKADFQSLLENEDSDVSNLLSYFSSSKTDATSFLSILNSAKGTTSKSGSGYFSSQLNAAQQLVDASYKAESVRRDSIITQVLARENNKLTASAVTTDTAAKLNLTV